MKKIVHTLPSFLSLLFLQATTVLAADGDITIRQPAQVKVTELGNLIGAGVGLIIVIALIITFFYLIIGGIKWITSGGDKGQVEEARNQITNALIGLAIVVGAWAIMKMIGFFFGIDVFKLTIPTAAD